MSYRFKGLGQTAKPSAPTEDRTVSDWTAAARAGGDIVSGIIRAATSPGTPAAPAEPTYAEPAYYPTAYQSSSDSSWVLPVVIGGMALLGIGAFVMMRRRPVSANKRRKRRRSRRSSAKKSGRRRNAAPRPRKKQAAKKRRVGRDVTYILPPRISDAEFEAIFGAPRRVKRNYAYEHISHPDKYPVRKNRITERQRARMSKKAFVFPSRRAWPINNARRAYAAIQFLRMGRVGSVSDFNEIRNAVRTRYPRVWDIYGKNLTWERSKAAKAKAKASRSRSRRSRRGGVRRARMAANTSGTTGWNRFGGMYRQGDWAWDGSSPFSRGDLLLWDESRRAFTLVSDNVTLDEANATIARRRHA